MSVFVSLAGRGERLAGAMTERQIEFPLAVSICAWCRPGDLGNGLGAQSHGICPRHFRKLQQELQRLQAGLSAVPARRRRLSREVGAESLALPL